MTGQAASGATDQVAEEPVATRAGPKDKEAFRPGSSAEKDALVGHISDKAVDAIPRKRLLTYRTLQVLLSPLIRLVFRTTRVNHKVVPKKGQGVLLAVNHVSWFDPILVVSCLGRPLSGLAKSYLFRGWFRTWFFETLGGQIRVDRARRGNLAAVRAAVGAINAGRCVGIWPEGGRSPDGHLTRGKTGIARIALETGAPVVPIAVLGSYDLKPKHAKRIRWGTKTKVVFGDPLTFPDDVGKHEDRDVTRRVTDTIMMEIAKLMGPDEAERYAKLLQEDVPPGQLPLDRNEGAEAVAPTAD